VLDPDAIDQATLDLLHQDQAKRLLLLELSATVKAWL
jgi:hypothetical protein